MCGIMGLMSDGRPEGTRATVREMMSAARHRGPDGSGSVEIALQAGTLVLGHTRLSIIDLSDDSRQPMQDAETGSWLIYNGEIYNFRQLRAELETEGARFASSGDTEVLLEALTHWGEGALEKLEGMFAFAFWDGRRRELLLARDGPGMKPLYYLSGVARGQSGSRKFAFASEVKILEQARLCPLTINHAAVDSFLAYGAVTGPNTIYEEIRELQPGRLLRVSERGEVAESEYWSLSRMLAAGGAPEVQSEVRNFDQAVSLIRGRLEHAVTSHLVSDVPVGVFLSGGVDSSLLALMASRQAETPITLLTVAFAEEEFSELPYARQIARSLPQHHHHEVVTLGAGDLSELLPSAIEAMDQPTVDGVNTFVISRVGARLGLKVLLTGVGGDELFGGYTTFTKVPRLLKFGAGLQPAARLLTRLRTAAGVENPVPWRKVADAGRPRNLAEAYLLQRSVRWRQVERNETAQSLHDVGPLANNFQRVAALELQFYMRNQLLRDADVFSMANSVELRVPFLDRQLMASALSIPPKYHFERGRGKRITWRILRELAGDKIPHRRKMGFTFPWERWLGRELKASITETLQDEQRYEVLALDPGYGKGLLDGLERGGREQSWTEVWSLFVLLGWLGRTGVEYAVA
jgi:asparagine synthase (glutamine-hydrolysing)